MTPKSNNINNRCGNTRCPMRFSCALDIENMPDFDIEGRCQMGWKPPKKKEENNGKKKWKRKRKAKRRSRPARRR